MQRSASVWVLIAVFFFAATGATQAATFDRKNSLLRVGPVCGVFNPPINAEDQGGLGTITLVDNGMGGHDLVLDQAVWSTANFFFPTALYTGVPNLDGFRLTVQNNSGTYTSNFTALNYLSGDPPYNVIGPNMGAVLPLGGHLVVYVLGMPAMAIPLEFVGGEAGEVFQSNIGGVPFTFTFEPWLTAPVPITGITTNVVSFNGVTGAAITLGLLSSQPYKVLSTNGGFVSTGGGLPLELHTVTVQGENNLMSALGGGTITLVSPMLINSSPYQFGRTPGTILMHLAFVPEPGTMLLLATAALGLVMVGRRRMRR